MTPEDASARLLAALEALAVEAPKLRQEIAETRRAILALGQMLHGAVGKVSGSALLAKLIGKL